jgi:predicted transcriptional regulator
MSNLTELAVQMTMQTATPGTPGDEIRAEVARNHKMLKCMETGEETDPEPAAPAIDPKRSIRKNDIVCLECGKTFTMLTKHLKSHGMTAREYRKKYGFASRQSLCAKALSDERSAASKERGIHPNLRKSIAERAGKNKKKLTAEG